MRVIEGSGLETAVQQWEARTQASKSIDVDWRTKTVRGPGRKAYTSTEEAAGDDEADLHRDDGSSSAVESESEDEFVQCSELQEEIGDELEGKM